MSDTVENRRKVIKDPKYTDAVRIKMTRGKTVLVSIEDADLVEFNWRPVSQKGYAGRTSKRKTIYLHRVVASRMFGDISGKIVDHINRDVLDCRRENIRLTNQILNTVNSSPRTSTGFKGVYITPKGYFVSVRVPKHKREKYGKAMLYGGTFSHIEDAKLAAYNLRAKLYGNTEYASLQ